MAKLKELGIAENTLVVCMADNGPMSHNPPPGLGMAETIYRGGKGDFLEGGVRVPAQAWWPGDDRSRDNWSATSFTKPTCTRRSLGGRCPEHMSRPIASSMASTRPRCCSTATRTVAATTSSSTRDRSSGATVKGNYKRHWISAGPGRRSQRDSGCFLLPAGGSAREDADAGQPDSPQELRSTG